MRTLSLSATNKTKHYPQTQIGTWLNFPIDMTWQHDMMLTGSWLPLSHWPKDLIWGHVLTNTNTCTRGLVSRQYILYYLCNNLFPLSSIWYPQLINFYKIVEQKLVVHYQENGWNFEGGSLVILFYLSLIIVCTYGLTIKKSKTMNCGKKWD